MKKYILFFVFFSFNVAFSQEDAWVYFNDKPNMQAFFDNPLSELSQRSLDRRANQNILLDTKDAPIYQPYFDQIAAGNGIAIKAKSKWFNCLHIQGTQEAIQSLTALSFVNRIDFANRTLNAAGKPRVVSKRTKKLPKIVGTNSLFDYGNSANQIQMLNGQLLHQENFTGSGKIIAVMDGGFPGVDTADPFLRLRNNDQILGGYDYVNRSNNFYAGINHGTMVLSTMGGYKEGQLVGTAPDASYYLFITEDGPNEGPIEMSLWVEAAEEADRLGVDILNTSLGYTEFDNPNYNFTYADMDGDTAFISKGVDIAFSRGMISVNSAGNSGNNSWFYISAPADAVHALTVGAVNAAGDYTSFSSQGPSFDGRVKPDVVAQGMQSVLSNANGTITTANGTSFSGPITAGMVACLWQALPDKTNAEIVQLIKESASIYNNPTNELGYGIPNFYAAYSSTLGVASNFTSTPLVYPNPFQEQVTFSIPNYNGETRISIYNSVGQRIYDQKVIAKNHLFNSANLSSGIYFYTIQSQDFIQTGKILKQ